VVVVVGVLSQRRNAYSHRRGKRRDRERSKRNG
jgi:hypothetical protein